MSEIEKAIRKRWSRVKVLPVWCAMGWNAGDNITFAKDNKSHLNECMNIWSDAGLYSGGQVIFIVIPFWQTREICSPPGKVKRI